MSEIAYSVAEARKQMGNIGHNKFYNEVNAGRLKVKKAGRKTIVPAESICAWLASLPEYQSQKTASAG